MDWHDVRFRGVLFLPNLMRSNARGTASWSREAL